MSWMKLIGIAAVCLASVGLSWATPMTSPQLAGDLTAVAAWGPSGVESFQPIGAHLDTWSEAGSIAPLPGADVLKERVLAALAWSSLHVPPGTETEEPRNSDPMDLKRAIFAVILVGSIWKYFTSPAWYRLLTNVFGPLDQY